MMDKSTIEKLKPLIEQLVEEKLLEVLGDPDNVLKLRPEIELRLKKSLTNKQKNIPIEEVAQKLKLTL